MESSGDFTNKDAAFSGWALVNRQGELMQMDADSDTSESSIEVVNVEDNNVVSFHHNRKERKVAEDAEEGNRLCGSPQAEVVPEEHCTETSVGEQNLGSQSQRVALESHDTPGVLTSCSSADFVEDISGTRMESTDDAAFHQSSEDVEFCGRGKEDDLSPGTFEAAETVQNSQPGRSSYGALDTKMITEQLDGACCMELLSECERSENNDGDCQENTVASADPEAGEEREMPNAIEDTGSEASSDSDFVCLDPENIGNFGVINPEVEMEPVLLHRARSSIDDNFRFMRAQAVEAPNLQPARLFNNEENDGFDGDIDRDDETESSAEEGIDDRIESEQSEAGSHSVLNDVGDLSAFADIGDIPLVVGDVRRNYIHRPNNHLSSVLNISLVLAAILTTGISLGIIMATDLEIEEWQNAYELQTMRVKQLETQLQEKKSLLGTQDSKVLQLISLSKQLQLRLADGTDERLKHKKMEKALDWLQARGIVEGGYFSNAAHLVQGVIQVFINCEEDLNVGDTDSDNASVVLETGVCSSQLEDFIVKFRVLADLERSYKRSDSFSSDKETWQYRNIDNAEIKDMRKGSGSGYLRDEGIRTEDADLDDDSSQAEDLGESSDKEEGHSFVSEANPTVIQGQGRVDLDIRQLQQSLSREQERALHWQHLYLSERRQRERERENEEWEDERDREAWEKEWKHEKESMEKSNEDFAELECLKRILASNLTTLTQHVTKWNVSVFDDFANLSILLSTVQDLKQSVVDTINKVWDGAEETLEDVEHRSYGNAEAFWGKDFVLRHYLLEIIHSLRQNSGPQLRRLLISFQDNFEQMKQGFENLKSDTVIHWIEHAWKVTEDIVGKLKNDIGEVVPEKEVLMAYLRNLLSSLEMKYDAKVQEQEANENMNDQSETVQSDNEEEDDDDDEEEEEEDYNYEKEGTQNTNENQGWSSGISNILSKTHKSFRQISRKVSRTFGEMRNIWYKKDRPLIRIAKHLTSKFMRASVKLTKMCTKLPAALFTGDREAQRDQQVLIYNKCVKKLRKRWQKHLLKNPCDAAGILSLECNSDKKTLKKDLKEVSKLFSQLLRIKTFEVSEVLQLSREDAELHHELFRSFLEHWGGRSMLLKKDLEWAACQRDWWSQVIQAMMEHNSEGNKLPLNECDVLSPHESFFPGGSMDDINKLKMKKRKHNSKKEDDDEDDKDGRKSASHVSNNIEHSKNQENKMNSSEAGKIVEDKSSSDWYTERARYRLQHKRSKDSNQGGRKKNHNDWFFKQAQHRKYQRDEHSRSDWLFERDRYRRQNTWNSKDQEQEKILNGKRRYLRDNWFIKHGHYRQQQRDEEHRADWMFDRAADRKEHHNSAFLDCDH